MAERIRERADADPQVSSSHPHEPTVAPVYDPDGRCLICSIMVESDELRAWKNGEKSWTNLTGGAPERYSPDVVAVMDAQEVVKHAAAIRGLATLLEVFDGRR